MLTGHFIPSHSGQIFLTQYGNIQGDTAVLCLPSITEELNLARAVVAKQAHRLAEIGLPCIQMDYFGTGDSEGEFEHANAEIWLQDVLAAGQWLTAQGVTKIVLWGVRFGGLLALANRDKLHEHLPIVHQLYWKPVFNGKQFMGQFIRIKQASEMMNSADNKVNWRQEILAGKPVEIAGYTLTAEMLNSIEPLVVKSPINSPTPVDIFDLSANALTPVMKRFTEQKSSVAINGAFLQCPPFWQVPEVFDVPELYEMTLSLPSIKELR